MRVVIISCVFPPEPMISGQTSSQIAEALRQQGHEVQLITSFPNRPAGRLYPGYSRRLYRCEKNFDGYDVLRCFSTLSGESSMFSRFLENLSFGITSGLAVLATKRPAVIYSNTWPIFATALIWFISRLRRIPMIVSIQDVYPESLIVQQRLRPDSMVAGGLRRIDGFVARRCRATITISSSFASIYQNQRRVASEQVFVVPNWLNGDAINPDDQHQVEVRVACKIPANAQLAVYGGNIGVAAGMETLIESFRHLAEEEYLWLLIAGEGSQLLSCQALARTIGNNRIAFYTPWPEQDTSRVLGAANFLILPTMGKQSLVSVPSKLITYMLSAKAVIALARPESDLAGIIKQSGCGWVVEPDRPDLLAAQIKFVMTLDVKELSMRGLAGREFALTHLTAEVCLPQVLDIIERVAAQ